MKKDLAVVFGLFFVVIVLLIFARGYTSIGQFGLGSSSTSSAQPAGESVIVKSKTLSIEAKVADSASERKRGLANQESLPLGEGMLFVFQNEGTYGIWMKDMKFAIDIVWLDRNKKIVDIAKNIPPEPEKKEDELTIYKPQSAALYVLEVNAGLTSLHAILVGDAVEFEL